MTTVMRLLPYLLVLAAAVLIWQAFPGGGEFTPLLGVALVPFFMALFGLPAKQRFLVGWIGGFALHLLLIYWLVTVLSQYGGLPVFIAVPALLLLISYMALYYGGLAVSAGLVFHHCPPVLALVGVPVVWVGFDWLRGVLFTGFPWMDLGYGLAGQARLIQVADLFGHSGVTFLVVMANTLFFLLIRHRKEVRLLFAPAVLGTLVLAVSLSYSVVRYRMLDTRLGDTGAGHRTMRVGVVQGNIEQNMKWSDEQLQRTIDVYLEQTALLAKNNAPSLVVWPETALPFYPAAYHGMDVFFREVKRNGSALLTGAPWYEIIDMEKRQIDYFNSAQILLPEGRYGESYYKSHLVPFGEYVPMRRFLPFLEPLVEAVGDFSPGKVEETLDWQDARIGVLICFESIFPEIARLWVEKGANVLVNLTNDAWYGKSSAPYQSMAMTSFRAVENRRSVVRAANTGISGFIDPLGRAAEPSAIFTLWSSVADIPLLEEKSRFVRWGYLFAPFCFFSGLLLVVLAAVRGRKNKKLPDLLWKTGISSD